MTVTEVVAGMEVEVDMEDQEATAEVAVVAIEEAGEEVVEDGKLITKSLGVCLVRALSAALVWTGRTIAMVHLKDAVTSRTKQVRRI